MSQLRRCDKWLATDGKWYLALGKDEHCYDDNECTFYGPFLDERAIDTHLANFPNTGSETVDNNGIEPPPDSFEPAISEHRNPRFTRYRF